MSKFKQLSLNLKGVFFITLITTLLYIAWGGILNQIIAGEGYYYFADSQRFSLSRNILQDYDNFPKLGTTLLSEIFKEKIYPYMLFQFLTIVALNIAFFVFLKKITKSYLVAFLGTVYFGVNYLSSFQFYARGHFQWFMQRVPLMFPIIASMFFMFKYLEEKKIKYYLLSFTLYFIALFMSHYTTFFLPFFAVYPLIWAVHQRIVKKKTIYSFFFAAVPFLVFNYFVVKSSSLGPDTHHPNQGVLESFFAIEDLLPKIGYQLTVATIPLKVIEFFKFKLPRDMQLFISNMVLPVVVLYAVSMTFLLKKIKNDAKNSAKYLFVLACFSALLGTLFLNVYLKRFNIYSEYYQGRYYYIPSFYIGAIFATILGAILKPLKIIGIFAAFIFCGLWLYSNTVLIQNQMKGTQKQYDTAKNLLAYIDQNAKNFPDGSYVLTDGQVISGSPFLENHYGRNGQIKFLYLDKKWMDKIPADLKENLLFVFSSSNQNVVDRSQEYRKELAKFQTGRNN